ncbi:hypothetical protein AURDEDRAFT_150918 [Auricularia subglabra TFB-10046 SS5]|nr:hypothetical protein AURDEDRAFT_150918 [Auricularia subglabra TFB-10046 SS5]
MAFPASARESAASLSLTSAPAPQTMQHPHHFAAAAQRVSFPSSMNLNVNANAKALPAPHAVRPRADSNVSATATLAQFNYATYMYYLSVAALLAQSQTADANASARGHMRVHSTASNTSLRSTSLSSTTSSSFDSLFTPGSARDGVRTPDTCSDIASDDDGTGCPLNDLPTSCADTPVEGTNSLCGERESQAHARTQHPKLASLAAAATLRSRPAPPAMWADDGFGAPHRPTSSYHRLQSPFADKTWWECVTHEKPWAPLATPIAKSEMPAVPLRRLSGPRSHNRNGSINSGFEHKRNARRRPSRAASTTLAGSPAAR